MTSDGAVKGQAGSRRALSGGRGRVAQRVEARWAWLLLTPTLIGLVVFLVGPMIFAFAMSFTEWSLLGPPKPIGMANYVALSRDGTFWEAWVNTAIYTLVSVPLSMLAGLLIALLLGSGLRGMAPFRVLFFMPMTVGVVASGLLWSWMFTPQYGLLNYLLGVVHLPPLPWLTSSSTSLLSIILVGVWRSVGFNIIVFLAGLQGIPPVYYEAARVDGADALHRFWHITIPLLSPTLFFGTLIGVIMSFQVFEQTYVMTQGGPGNSTLTIIYFIFQQGFTYLRMGYASAASVTFLLMIGVLTLIMTRLQLRVHYEN